tara:strand:- start:211 stop:1002 length:792 start_codon:yes stop_codon:yes gene_type:complete
MLLQNVTVGADPEVFVADMSGTITSAIGKVGGSKDYPRPVMDGGVQEDNVLAEFNINPAKSKLEFVCNISSVMGSLRNILENNNLQPVIVPSHKFTAQELSNFGPEAMEFGCSSEWNAWDSKVMPRPKGDKVNLRTAGGHVHVGYDNPDRFIGEDLIKLMDYAIGVPSVLIDTDKHRRKLYGKAGSMRHKPYGVEYRTLSNFWLNSDELTSWVYDRTLWCTQNLHRLPEFVSAYDPQTLKRIINLSDTALATDVVHELSLETV